MKTRKHFGMKKLTLLLVVAALGGFLIGGVFMESGPRPAENLTKA